MVYAMVERLKDLINSLVTQDRVYWLCFVLLCVLVLFQLYLFIALRIYVSLLKSVISHNQAHGFGISVYLTASIAEKGHLWGVLDPNLFHTG